ncbi:MAG: kelch repeat-containing protein [Thiohalospira sp.]
MRKFYVISLILSIFIISSCNKEEELRISEILETKYVDVNKTFNDNVTFGGTLKKFINNIEDHGFVYGTSPSPQYEIDSTISLGIPEIEGNFSEIVHGFNPGTMYYTRAFVKTDKKILYGEDIDFHITIIDKISKKYAGKGGTIVIHGTNFGEKKSDNIVKINNIAVDIVSISHSDWGSDITIKIPTENINLGIKDVSIEINGIQTILNEAFEVIPYTEMPNLPGLKRVNAVGFSINGLFYIGTGYDSNNQYRKDFYCYNPESRTWSEIADLPGVGRSGAVAFTIHNFAYVGLGTNGSGSLTDFYKYNPSTNSWTQISNFSGDERADASAFTLTNQGYVGLGCKAKSQFRLGEFFNDFFIYNPNDDSWSELDTVAISARTDAASIVYEDKVYIGKSTHNSTILKEDFWEFEPIEKKWTKIKSPGGDELSIQFPKGFTIKDKGYIVGSLYYYEFDFISQIWNQFYYLHLELSSNFFRGIGISNGEFAIIGLGGENNCFYEFRP